RLPELSGIRAGPIFRNRAHYTEIVIHLRGLEPAREACWEIEGGLGKPMQVWYEGALLRGVSQVISHPDGRVLLELESRSLSVRR
ncbi:MAG: hypothetical protein ACEQSB_07280, partial [Undibacterium sp.]